MNEEKQEKQEKKPKSLIKTLEELQLESEVRRRVDQAMLIGGVAALEAVLKRMQREPILLGEVARQIVEEVKRGILQRYRSQFARDLKGVLQPDSPIIKP